MRDVPGTVGGVGLGAMECQLWALTNPFLWTLSLSCWHSDIAVSSLHSLNSAGRQHQCHPQNPAGVPVGLVPGTGGGTGQSIFHSSGASACTAWHQLKSALASAQGDVLHSPSSLGT